MDCEQVTKREITEKYLLGRLSEAEQEAFEQHYFECARCFEELQTYRALQTELKQVPAAIQREPIAPRRAWRWAWAAAPAVVLLAVGLGLWLRRPVPRSTPSATRSVMLPPKAQQPLLPPVPSLSELTNFQAPSYAPTTLRGTQDEATHRFREAMRHYVKGDYGASIPGLKAASKLNPRAADISFFLGICFLLTNQTDTAINQLRRTVALGDSPYLEDAYLYLAKAHLRERDLDTAQRELNKIIELHGDREAEARRLLDQLQRLRNAPR